MTNTSANHSGDVFDVSRTQESELRVLHVFSALGMGGAETWLMALLKYFNEVKNQTQNQSCDDPLDCSEGCTGLGKAVATARACNEKLMNDLFTAAGIPPRGVDKSRKIDWVANWDPQSGPISDTAANMCVSET